MAKKVGIEIQVDSKGAITSFKQLGNAGKSATKDITEGSDKASGSMGGLNLKTIAVTGSFLALGAVAGKFAKDFISAGVTTLKQAEKVETQFKTILGSAEAAQERYAELAQFAASTPFRLNGVANASKILETLTKGTLSTGDNLRMVGDAAAIAGVGFDELSIHIGRAYSGLQANRPIGEAMARLQELGLVSGETRNQIESLQKQAKGKEAWEVLQTELSKTKGGMEELSKTLEGRTSTLVDNVGFVAAALLEVSGATDLWKESLKGLNDVATKSLEGLELMKIKQKEVSDLTIKEAETLRDSLKLQQRRIADAERYNTLTKEQAQLMAAGASLEDVKKRSIVEIRAVRAQIKAIDEVIEKRKIEKQEQAKAAEEAETQEKAKIARQQSFEVAKLEETMNLKNEIRNMGLEFEIEQHNEAEKRKAKLTIEKFLETEREKQKADAQTRAKQIKADEADEKLKALKRKQEIKSAIGDSARALDIIFENNKASAIANTGLWMFEGIQRALALPFPLNWAQAGLVGAAGAKNLANISGIKLANGGVIDGPGTNRSDSVRTSLSRGEGVLNQPTVERIGGAEAVDSLNNGGGFGGNINVNITAGAGTDLDSLAQTVTNAVQRATQLGLEPSIV